MQRYHKITKFYETIIENKCISLQLGTSLWSMIKQRTKCFRPSHTLFFHLGEMMNRRHEEQTRDWYKGVWCSHSTPKYPFIVWLTTHNRLTTWDKMCGWNSGVSYACVFCHASNGFGNHLPIKFFDTDFQQFIQTSSWSSHMLHLTQLLISSGVMFSKFRSTPSGVNAIKEDMENFPNQHNISSKQ